MVKLVALYRKPADPTAFDKAYFETHVPLVKKIPNLRRVEIARVTGAPRGESELYLMAEMYFDDKAALDAAMASPENVAAGKNLMSFARGLVTFVYAEDVGLIESSSAGDARAISSDTIVNDVIAATPETMEVLEDHGIRICGGCIVLLNALVRETAEYSGLSPAETFALVEELNAKARR
jgi:uncharacterized protein (TIGR02118 family)